MQAHVHRSTADNEAAHGIVQPSHWKNTADRLQYVEPRGVGRDGTQPHPAERRVVLLELLVGGRTDVPFAVKRDGARDRGALVEGEDVRRPRRVLGGQYECEPKTIPRSAAEMCSDAGPQGSATIGWARGPVRSRGSCFPTGRGGSRNSRVTR